MGLKRDNYFWTQEEKEIIRKYYPSEGAKIVKRLPDRTIPSIKNQAKKMRVFAIVGSFSKHEDQLIRDFYRSLGGLGLHKMMPHHSAKEIYARANDIGVKKQLPKIICVETGQIFKNARQAGKFASPDSKHANVIIIKCCKDHKLTAYGYHWRYCDE